MGKLYWSASAIGLRSATSHPATVSVRLISLVLIGAAPLRGSGLACPCRGDGGVAAAEGTERFGSPFWRAFRRGACGSTELVAAGLVQLQPKTFWLWQVTLFVLFRGGKMRFKEPARLLARPSASVRLRVEGAKRRQGVLGRGRTAT